MQPPSDSDYNITLTKGTYFHSLKENYETIYRNFCLLSYLTNQVNVRIDHRHFSFFWNQSDLFQKQPEAKSQRQNGSCTDKIYLDRFTFKREKKEKKIYYLVQCRKTEWKGPEWTKKSSNSSEYEQTFKKSLKYFIFEQSEFLADFQVKRLMEQYDEVIKQRVIKQSRSQAESFVSKKVWAEVEKIKNYSFVKLKYIKKSEKQRKSFEDKLFFRNLKVLKQELMLSELSDDNLDSVVPNGRNDKQVPPNFYEKIIYVCLNLSKPNENFPQVINVINVTISAKKKEAKDKFRETKDKMKKKEDVQATQQQIVCIKISDPKGFFKNKLVFSKSSQNRESINLNLSEDGEQFEYFYQQPRNIQTKFMNTKHFSFALQGGGVKGMAYIGAYKAFWNFFSKRNEEQVVPVKSIIGSSAGGILGLSICCQLNPEEMEELVTQYMQHVPQQDKIFNEQHSEQENLLLESIKSYLTQNQILDEEIFFIIQPVLKSKNLQASLLGWLKKNSQSVEKLLYSKKFKERVLVVYGILMGSLLKGEMVRQIGTHILSLYYKRRYYEKYQLVLDQMQSLREYMKTFTLKQFYDDTKIEFTCTAADVDDQILRFFNHKTTPDLPVCYAIQITGSLPIAFQGQYWRKEWGKYYIHYHDSRRQLTLMKNDIGNQFTDGGTLDNFPVRFLDNKKIRSKYFSHPRVLKEDNKQHYTIIYAFGVDDQSDEALDKMIKQIFCQRLWKKSSKFDLLTGFVWEVSNVASKIGFSWLKKILSQKKEIQENQSTTQRMQKIRNIPFFKFLIRLIEMWTRSKDNLTKECFSYMMCKITNFYEPTEEILEKQSHFNERYQNVKNFMEKRINEDQSNDKKILKEELYKIQKFFKSKQAEYRRNNETKSEIKQIVWQLKKEIQLFDNAENQQKFIKAIETYKSQDEIQSYTEAAISTLSEPSFGTIQSLKEKYQENRFQKYLLELGEKHPLIKQKTKKLAKHLSKTFQEVDKVKRNNQNTKDIQSYVDGIQEKDFDSERLFELNFYLYCLDNYKQVTKIQKDYPAVKKSQLCFQKLAMLSSGEQLKDLCLKIEKAVNQILQKRPVGLCDQFKLTASQIQNGLKSIRQGLNEPYQQLKQKYEKLIKAWGWSELHQQSFNILNNNLDQLKKQKLDFSLSERNIFKTTQKIEAMIKPLIAKLSYFIFQRNHGIQNSVVKDLYERLSGSMETCAKVNQSQVFWYSQVAEDFSLLSQSIRQVEQTFSKMKTCSCKQYSDDQMCAKQIFWLVISDEYKEQSDYYYDLVQEIKHFRQATLHKLITKAIRKERTDDQITTQEFNTVFPSTRIEQIQSYDRLFRFDEAQRVYQLSSKLFAKPLDKNKPKFFNEIKKINISELENSKQTFKQLTYIRYSFQNTLITAMNDQNQRRNVHLVLESGPRSQLYFHELMKIINDEIEMINKDIGQAKFKVTQITGSNYNALAMFLIGMNLQQSQMQRELQKIKDCVEVDEGCDNYFENGSWLQKNNTELKRIAINTLRYELMEKVKTGFQQGRGYTKQQIITQVNKNFGAIKKEIDKAIESIMQFVQKSLKDREKDSYAVIKELRSKIKNNELKNVDQIIQFVQKSLKDKKNDFFAIIDELKRKVSNKQLKTIEQIMQFVQISLKDREKDLAPVINQLRSKFSNDREDRVQQKQKQGTQQLISLFKPRLKLVFQHMIVSSPFIMEQLKYHALIKSKKTVWKGIIIGKALKMSKIKDFVQKILKKNPLFTEDCTLKEFYEKTNCRYQLNFATIHVSEGRLHFLNHQTAPNFPVWAAITASMSLPFFNEPFKINPEWTELPPHSSYCHRQMNETFKRRDNISELYTGDILSKIPLESMTNEKIREVINEKSCLKKQIFFVMSFKRSNKKIDFSSEINQMNKKELNQQELKRPPPAKSGGLLKLLWLPFKLNFKYGMGFLNMFSGASFPTTNFFRQAKYVLQLYMGASDNMVKKIYSKQIVLIPIKLGTIDFHKVSLLNDKNKLSIKAVETIQQAKYVLKEKLANVNQSFMKQEIEENQHLDYVDYRDELNRPIRRAKKRVYFKVKFDPILGGEGEQGAAPRGIILKFYSFGSKVKSNEENYNIYYSKPDSPNFIKVMEEEVKVYLNHANQIKIKVQFPNIIYASDPKESSIAEPPIAEQIGSYTQIITINHTNMLSPDRASEDTEPGPWINASFTYNWPTPKERQQQRVSIPTSYKITVSTDEDSYKDEHCLKCLNKFFEFFVRDQSQNKKCIRCLASPSVFRCASCKPEQPVYCVNCYFKLTINQGRHFHLASAKQEHRIKKGLQKRPSWTTQCSICGCWPVSPHYDEQCKITFCSVCLGRFIRRANNPLSVDSQL